MKRNHEGELIPVVIYSRYSTMMQDSRSIDDQVRRCKEYAKRNDMEVVALYDDKAESGSHMEREGVQRMLAAARKKLVRFERVLVDDLSRLSRDLGNTWQVIYGDFASLGIYVVDVSSGVSSENEDARLMIATKGAFNDHFLQTVRKMTHRGLEGRALAGFWAGGRVYGYRTVVEPNPPDPEHPRKIPVIDEEQAELVRRVFVMWVEGRSLKSIASTLNEEGIPAPNDGGRGNKVGRGWGHTTIREMLMNERYIGRFIWNKWKWLHPSGGRSRVRRLRPESEWIVRDVPELAIVDRALWTAASKKFSRRTPGRRRPEQTAKRASLVSGLLRCGACGGSMVVVGRKQKGNQSFAAFGCTAHWSRGSSICSNNQTINDTKISKAIIDALRSNFDKEAVGRFVDKFQKRVAANAKKASSPTAALEKKVREHERRLANLTEAVSKLGYSDELGAKMREEQEALARARYELSSATKETGGTKVAHPTAIVRFFERILDVLESDPARGREILSRIVSPIIMKPTGDRYEATGAFNIGFFLNPPPPAQNAEDGVLSKSSCAGLQRHLLSTENAAFSGPLSLPLRLAV